MEESKVWDHLNHSLSGKLDSGKLINLYDDWSKDYNKDSAKVGYNGPVLGAQKIADLMTAGDARILDVGCGTGRVAEELSLRGFTNIDGVDASPKSIGVARESGNYKGLYAADINKDGLPVDANSYNGVVTVGCFSVGHLNQSVFPELCRVVKPGGYIVLVMREEFIYTGPDFKGGQLDSAVVALCENGVWNYVSRDRKNNYIGDKHGVVFTFQKK